MSVSADYFDDENVTPTDIVAALEGWSRTAQKESSEALAADDPSKAARLLGKAQGLSLAAQEMRLRLPIDPCHFGPHGGWATGIEDYVFKTAATGARQELQA